MRLELGHQSGSGKGTSLRNRKPINKLLSIREDEGVYRARLVSGSLRSLDTKQLRAEIAGLHTPGKPPMVMFSMRGMDTLASGCLGAFAELGTDLERVGGVLVLYNLPKEIAKVLRKTKLDRVIQTAKTRPQARKKVLALGKKNAESIRMNAA